jgi:hypothetical protein
MLFADFTRDFADWLPWLLGEVRGRATEHATSLFTLTRARISSIFFLCHNLKLPFP